MSVNRHTIIGRLGQDPNFKKLDNGSMQTKISVATSFSYVKKGTSKKIEQTEWTNVVFYGKQADICRKHCKKGTKVYVSGRHKTTKYNDKYYSELVASEFDILSEGNWGNNNDDNENEAYPQNRIFDEPPF
jgi:single-strand DNA-binding protein